MIPQRPSRNLWIAAIIVSALCVGGLVYALVSDWNAEPDAKTLPSGTGRQSSGFGLGLVIGIGAGIVIGSLIALRLRTPAVGPAIAERKPDDNERS